MTSIENLIELLDQGRLDLLHDLSHSDVYEFSV